ncbi:hypothetical protein [Burkholderia sp. AU45388]|uniref:hypothetical protein n=1 Tax=Burkholderia sp. AU45388 TaxID=3059206 RepID=UPI0026507A14|nr:hypothetical protein [Burkholderia sp. AU45388]MDN7429062.1 hypothetical protein [Burkholderia sp. AU45388]
MNHPNSSVPTAANPMRPVIQTWRLTRIGLQRLGDFELVELARGGPSADLEADLRAALAAWPGTLTLRPNSPADRRQRWLQGNGRAG